jgi:hypothetical protein
LPINAVAFAASGAQGQGDTGDQADDDLRDQADAFEALQEEGAAVINGISDFLIGRSDA